MECLLFRLQWGSTAFPLYLCDPYQLHLVCTSTWQCLIGHEVSPLQIAVGNFYVLGTHWPVLFTFKLIHNSCTRFVLQDTWTWSWLISLWSVSSSDCGWELLCLCTHSISLLLIWSISAALGLPSTWQCLIGHEVFPLQIAVRNFYACALDSLSSLLRWSITAEKLACANTGHDNA